MTNWRETPMTKLVAGGVRLLQTVLLMNTNWRGSPITNPVYDLNLVAYNYNKRRQLASLPFTDVLRGRVQLIETQPPRSLTPIHYTIAKIVQTGTVLPPVFGN